MDRADRKRRSRPSVVQDEEPRRTPGSAEDGDLGERPRAEEPGRTPGSAEGEREER